METPPRAWGRRAFHSVAIDVTGNTPTCVGKTSFLRNEQLAQEKHPHVRGEDLRPVFDNVSPEETPPRAWGRLPFRTRIQRFDGNTPTCVGKT